MPHTNHEIEFDALPDWLLLGIGYLTAFAYAAVLYLA